MGFFFLGFGGVRKSDSNEAWVSFFVETSVREWKDDDAVIKETDLVLWSCRTCSDCGDDESFEWGSHDFKIGVKELLRVRSMVCDFRESMGLFSWNLLIFEIIYLRNQIIYFKT